MNIVTDIDTRMGSCKLEHWVGAWGLFKIMRCRFLAAVSICSQFSTRLLQCMLAAPWPLPPNALHPQDRNMHDVDCHACTALCCPGAIPKDMVFPILKQLLIKNGLKERRLREYFNSPHYPKIVGGFGGKNCWFVDIVSDWACATLSHSNGATGIVFCCDKITWNLPTLLLVFAFEGIFSVKKNCISRIEQIGSCCSWFLIAYAPKINGSIAVKLMTKHVHVSRFVSADGFANGRGPLCHRTPVPESIGTGDARADAYMASKSQDQKTAGKNDEGLEYLCSGSGLHTRWLFHAHDISKFNRPKSKLYGSWPGGDVSRASPWSSPSGKALYPSWLWWSSCEKA